MTIRVDERATEFEEIDRFDGGVGWIAHPEERMRRASHALAVDGQVWVIDPVDAEGLDDLLAEFGEVAGVAVLIDRHVRDAEAIANRHDVNVYLPTFFDGVAEELEAPVVRFEDELADTGIEAYPLWNNRFWREVALWNPEDGTLVVPESVGTASHFLAGKERLGVHPMLRLTPPRDRLGRFRPERVLVGHGSGVLSDATHALTVALEGSRKRTPRLYGEAVRELVPV